MAHNDGVVKFSPLPEVITLPPGVYQEEDGKAQSAVCAFCVTHGLYPEGGCESCEEDRD